MRRALWLSLFLATGALFGAEPITKDVCLACHDTIDAAKFGASVHGPLECTNCHADVTSVPHETKPKAVQCASCHPDAVAAWDISLHAKAVKSGLARGARCTDCHGSAHEILSSSDKQAPTNLASVVKTCSRCHAQKFVMEKAGLSAQSAI